MPRLIVYRSFRRKFCYFLILAAVYLLLVVINLPNTSFDDYEIGLIKKALNTSRLTPYGKAGGGYINQGSGYQTYQGDVFIKRVQKIEKSSLLLDENFMTSDKIREMFEGEYAGLKEIYETRTVRVPRPISVFDDGKGGTMFAAEYLEFKKVEKFGAELGTKLARLHLYNSESLMPPKERSAWFNETSLMPITHFGFHVKTYSGYLPQENKWSDDWIEFFTEKLLGFQMNLARKLHDNEEIDELWSKVKLKISYFFKDCSKIVPALLHSDLCYGNIGETDQEPLIFDPASFYGHHEMDLALPLMFGSFPGEFFEAYHKIPKEHGFEKRMELYQLYYWLIHWNHFEEERYRNSSLYALRKLVEE